MEMRIACPYDPEPVRRLLSRHRAYLHPYTIRFAGLDLVIDNEVFSPNLTKTSSLMLGCLETIGIVQTWRVADVFTGSGAFAVYAAAKGCRTLAIDISPAAAACAAANATRHGVGDHVEVRIGDGLSALNAGEVFDLVIASPPLLPGEPTGLLEKAVFDPDLKAILDVIAALPAHLAPRGRALLTLSDVFGRIGHDILDLAARHGLQARPIAERDADYEVYSVYELRRDRPEPPE
jgi:methylase of polypeptide subunit release factors